MYALITLFLFVLWWYTKPRGNSKQPETILKPPGPKPWPVIGSLHLLGQHATPFEAFAALQRIYGDIFSINLGTTPCVVVNSFKLIKEVLISKGGDFGGRPNFTRFHKLFGGDRNNSLALCDWSSLQKTRRSIARMYCSPRFTSLQYDRVSSVGNEESGLFLRKLEELPHGKPVHVKPLVLQACANMFTKYMCSSSFGYDDIEFNKIVSYFDDIFWEINQGYAVDFLPWLLPIYAGHMKKLSNWASKIRCFILSRIVNEHRATLDQIHGPRDFTDALLMHLEKDPNMNWQHIIFELEDFIGGHSAVANLVMITLSEIVQHPEVGKRIQDEIDSVTGGLRRPNLSDKPSMPYTEAALLETLRKASSPIVPHVATTDTTIDGYDIKKGTVVFINNYELNMSQEYWKNPESFSPERFISSLNGGIVKPSYFIPFSTGKRTCIGQRLVHCFGFVVLSTILQHFNVSAKESVYTRPGCMAVPPDCFKLILTSRRKL